MDIRRRSERPFSSSPALKKPGLPLKIKLHLVQRYLLNAVLQACIQHDLDLAAQIPEDLEGDDKFAANDAIAKAMSPQAAQK